MANHTFEVSLDSRDITLLIKKLKKYKKDFEEKCNKFTKIIGERIAEEAQVGFNNSIVDDLTDKSGGARMAEVKVDIVKSDETTTYVIAQGTDAVWVEFGAGVFHNGAVGSSPNPYGAALGFTIGSFGDKGARKTWAFYEDGELKYTRGTPASRPLYNSVQKVLNNINDIIREVFG